MNKANLCYLLLLFYCIACNPNAKVESPKPSNDTLIAAMPAKADTITPPINPQQKKDTANTAITDTVINTQRLITCEGVGPIKFTDSYNTLEKKFGKKNLQQDSVFTEGEFQGLSTIVWPNTAKQVTVYWLDIEPPFKKIMSLMVEGKKSEWHLPNGLKVGMTLPEIVKLNGGKQINFYGFGWDYGGSISNFGNGDIAKNYPCVGGILLPHKDISEKDSRKILGDKEINSSVRELSKYDVRLTTLIVANKKVQPDEAKSQTSLNDN